MRRFFPRFAAVGVVATAVDLAVLVAGRALLGLPVLVADGAALLVAAVLSWRLHRAVGLPDDPLARAYRVPGVFTRVAVIAAVVDLAVVRSVVEVIGAEAITDLLVAKVAAVVAAASVRFVGYRRAVVPLLREDQRRGTAAGDAPPGDRRLSVVVPAYREQATIGHAVADLRRALAPDVPDVEIVVVDDGSPDGTSEEAARAGADQVIRLPQNRGKGAAVRAGALAARGRTIAFTDADLAYPPEQLLRLLAEVEAGCDVVVGSRRHVDTTTLVRARRLREVTGRLFNVLTFLVLLGQYRDTQCGLKAFRSDAARALFARTRVDRFAFDVELFHLAERDRLSLREVPVALANTRASSVRVGADAVRMLRDLVRIRVLAARGVYERRSPGSSGDRRRSSA